MGLKIIFARCFAILTKAKIKKWSNRPFEIQEKVFHNLILKAKETKFGRDHNFNSIQSYEDFIREVPIRDYENLKKYIELVKNGEKNILWPGLPLYFCKTSGTTSGIKYIPLTKESLPNHINSARNALLSYISETGESDFINGKMIFIQGSPILETINGIPFGRLSGIVAHHVPNYLQKNRMPSFPTNCIEDWEQKIEAIVDETINHDMTVIAGIPAWVQMYFERLQERSNGKPIKDIFPNFKLLIFGGVNFEPYTQRFDKLIGGKINYIEVYPASEGFFAYQDQQTEKGMILLLNDGIYYEFIKAEEFFKENPKRINIEKVELNVNYALIINSNAGLWGYSIGDTVKFISNNPYRIIVTGRINHFISAFGEHVISEEVESSIQKILTLFNAELNEFTVAPQVAPLDDELPYHEWFIEFEKTPNDIDEFRKRLDEAMQEKNQYYADLIKGKVIQPLKITIVQKGGFSKFMKSRGKLGGQNKIPRLSNDRTMANELKNYTY